MAGQHPAKGSDMHPNPFTELAELHRHLALLKHRVEEERDPLLRAAREDQMVAVLALIGLVRARVQPGQSELP
jgi:hypothetical protein